MGPSRLSRSTRWRTSRRATSREAHRGVESVSHNAKVPPRWLHSRGRGTERTDLPMQNDPNPAAVPLVEQPTWSRAHAGLLHVPPFSDMSPAQSRPFARAISTATREQDLSAHHQRWLREAETNLAKVRGMRVDLWQDGEKVIATFRLHNGTAVREGGPSWLDGVKVLEPGDPPVVVHRGEGERFLRALVPSFAGSRLRAVLVNDEAGAR
jgi:hypothetical protein